MGTVNDVNHRTAFFELHFVYASENLLNNDVAGARIPTCKGFNSIEFILGVRRLYTDLCTNSMGPPLPIKRLVKDTQVVDKVLDIIVIRHSGTPSFRAILTKGSESSLAITMSIFCSPISSHNRHRT